MGAGTGWAGWAWAHPGNYLGGHCPPNFFAKTVPYYDITAY